MAGGFLGLPNPWARSPMQSLTDLSEVGAPTPAPPPVAPSTPEPEATSAILAAAGGGTPVPAAPSRGFGDVLSDAFSGRGIMGARPGDDKVDPSTGATVGQGRQANMSSMMQLGMLLMAAGARQTDDSRAALLAKAPGLLNNTDQINSFALTRLKMAEARMAERKQAAAEQKAGYVRSLLGGSGAASLGAPAAASAGGGAPGTLTPVTAPTGGLAPAQGPETTGSASAPAGGALAASGGPTPSAGGVTEGMSRGEVAAIAGMDDERALELLARRRGELDGQETFGAPYNDPATGQRMVPVLKGGRQVRVQSLGALQSTVTEEGGKRVTRQGGAVTGIADAPEDPQDVEERRMGASLRGKRFDALEAARPAAETAVIQYGRVRAAEDAVLKNRTMVGLGVDAKTKFQNVLGLFGQLTDEGREWLRNTSDVNAILSQSSGEFAKRFYGPQISNADVENARAAIGGVLSNDPSVVAQALKRVRGNYRETIEKYNKDVEGHNSRLSGIRSEGLRSDLTAQPVQWQRAPDDYSDAERAAARAELARRRAATQR